MVEQCKGEEIVGRGREGTQSRNGSNYLQAKSAGGEERRQYGIYDADQPIPVSGGGKVSFTKPLVADFQWGGKDGEKSQPSIAKSKDSLVQFVDPEQGTGSAFRGGEKGLLLEKNDGSTSSRAADVAKALRDSGVQYTPAKGGSAVPTAAQLFEAVDKAYCPRGR